MTRQEEVHKAILETELTPSEIEEAIWEKKKAKYMTRGNRLNDPYKKEGSLVESEVGQVFIPDPFKGFTEQDIIRTVEMFKNAFKQ